MLVSVEYADHFESGDVDLIPESCRLESWNQLFSILSCNCFHAFGVIAAVNFGFGCGFLFVLRFHVLWFEKLLHFEFGSGYVVQLAVCC